MLQTKNKKNTISRCSSVKGLRRLISVFLLISLSLTGCKSILVNGNLSFKAYDPVSPMSSQDGIHNALLNDVDFEKYNIDGESAFWMPPFHLNPIYINYDMNDPTKDALMADFKVVGYSENKARFVYAYITPVFTDGTTEVDSKTALSIPKSGNAADITVPAPGNSINAKCDYALVLMSYEPTTKDYNVFFSTCYDYEYYSGNQPPLIAGKVEGSDSYYIYDQRQSEVVICDIDGNTLSERCYVSEISSSLRELLDGMGTWELSINPNHYRYTVSDIQVDDKLYVYFNLQVEVSENPFDDQSIANQIDENDTDDSYDEDENSDYDEVDKIVYFNAVVTTFSLNIGEDSAIKFTSRIKDEAKTLCEQSVNLSPITLELPGWLIDNAKSEMNKNEKEADRTEAKLREYIKNNQDYSSTITNKVNEYTANGGKKVYDSYYGKVQSTLNKGYTVFDNADMGSDVYYALAGITNINYIPLSDKDGKDLGYAYDPRYSDSTASSAMHYLSFEANYITQTPLSFAQNVVGNYLAGRNFVPYIYSGMPSWIRDFFTREYLLEHCSSEIYSMARSGSLAGYFLLYGDELRYPYLSPGSFNATGNDSAHPDMKKVSSSPFSSYSNCIDKSDGFYKYGNGVNREFTSLASGLPMVLLYGEQKYSDGSVVSNYSAIMSNPRKNEGSLKNTYCLPKMVVDETMPVTVKQPLYVNIRGSKEFVKDVEVTLEIPTKYRMVFPKTSMATAKGNIWVGEGVKALKDLGCVTYKERSFHTNTKGEWTYPYDALNNDIMYFENKDQKYSWIQQMHQGYSGSLIDECMPGVARDVGSYRTADNKEEVIFLSDEALRLYVRGEKKFRAIKEISIDTIKRVSGYGLNVEGAVQEDHETQTDKVQTKTDEMVNDAMDQEQSYNLMADNLMPYSETKLMICHESDGISLFDTKGETLMKLLGGHYYRIYPMKKSGEYMLVGFQSEQYDYSLADTSMAKYYVIDLGNLIRKEGNSNVDSYIDELKDIYHSLTHTLKYEGRDENKQKMYSVVQPPEPGTNKDYDRAVRLFTISDEETEKELQKICDDFGVELTDTIKKHGLEVAEKVQKQRQALNAYYKLIGIQVNNGGLPDKWQYIMVESDVFTASYEGMLEIMLVEMVLSDYYMDPNVTTPLVKPSRHFRKNSSLVGVVPETGAVLDEYIGYRDAYREWLEMRTQSDSLVKVSGNEAGVDIQGMDEDQLKGTIVDLYNDRTAVKDAQSITQMEFYRIVLDDIKNKYEQVNDPTGEKEIPAFEDYLTSLFEDISPDYGNDVFSQMKKSGYDLFYEMTGLPKQENVEVELKWKEEDLMKDLEDCRFTWQVEEVIVKYKLKTAEYLDNAHYQEAWLAYTGNDYSREEDEIKAQETAFKASDCYKIIEDLKKKSLSSGLGMTWDEAVEDVLRKVAKAPVIMIEEEQ